MDRHERRPIEQPAAAPPNFGLGSLLLVTVLPAACLGLGRIDPLLGLSLAIMTAPALSRTAEAVCRRRQAGKSVTNGQKLLMFLSSLGLVAAAVATTAAVLLLVASLAGGAGLVLARAFNEPWLPVVTFAWGAVLGLPAGIVAAARVVQRWPALRYEVTRA